MMTWRWRLEVKRAWVLRSIIGCLRTSPSRLLSPNVHAILAKTHESSHENTFLRNELSATPGNRPQISADYSQMGADGDGRRGKKWQVQKASSYGSGVIRMRSGSTTEKWPDQSSRLSRAPTTIEARRDGLSAATRRSTIPEAAGSLNRNANSPKSLSKVTTMRSSLAALRRTSLSALPGASARIHPT